MFKKGAAQESASLSNIRINCKLYTCRIRTFKISKGDLLLKIAVIDGQGGGMGKALVEMIRTKFGNSVTIVALGSNSAATVAMLKAGADEGATGENAVVFNASRVDIIVGPIGIIAPNSMMGELSPAMAGAITESPALKILIPVNRCNMLIAGVQDKPMPQYMESAVEMIAGHMTCICEN